MREEWGEWIKHTGTYVPGPIGTPVRVRWQGGMVEATWIGADFDRCIAAGRTPMGSWLWATAAGAKSLPILAYQMRQGIEEGLEVCRQIVHAVLDHPPPMVDPVEAPPAAAPADPDW